MPSKKLKKTRLSRAVKGFTLIELMITTAVLAISMAIALPSMRTALDRSWLLSASESITAELRFARSESIKRNQAINITFNGATGNGSTETWCFGLSASPGCDCTLSDVENANACTLTIGGEKQLKIVTSETFSKISLQQNFTGNSITINPVRGTANAGSVFLESPENQVVQVQTNFLGRVHICSDDIAAYPVC